MSRRRAIRNKGVIAAARRQYIPEPGARLAFRIDPWTRKLIRPLLIALLATSVSIALLVIARIVTPELGWMTLVPFCFIAALEGVYTSAWLNNPDSNGVDRMTYRAAEMLLILVLARVYSWIVFGHGIPSPDDMRLFLLSPIAVLATGAFVSTAVIALVAWGIGVSLGRTFTRLDLSVYELNFYTLSPAEQKAKADDRPIQIAREDLQNQFLNTWLVIGMVMVFLAALSTYEVRELTSVTNPFEITRLGLTPAMLFALMTYFLVGFWLLSHARLLRMNARWLVDGVAKETSLERGWQRSTSVLLIAIAFLAAFLPIGSTLAISRILTIGLAGIAYLFNIFISFFGYLFASTIMLLTQNVEETEQPIAQPTPVPTPEPPPAPPVETSEFLSMVVSSAFWALVIAFIIAAFLFFLRERGYRIDKTVVGSYWVTFASWVREMWQRLRGRARSLSHELQVRLRRPPSLGPSHRDRKLQPPRFLRLGELSPREQIRFYYLALVRRAAESGVDRRESETPLEFAQDLKETWPDTETEVDDLTQAFLEARYSPRPIEKPTATTIKERWKTLRTRLRRPR